MKKILLQIIILLNIFKFKLLSKYSYSKTAITYFYKEMQLTKIENIVEILHL
jgi:hypothetical protein